MLRPVLTAALLTALPLPAQGQDVPAPAPILRLLSRDAGLLAAAGRLFEAEPAPLALERDDQCGELVVQHDRRSGLRVATGLLQPGCHSELTLQPRGLGAAFEQQLAAARPALAAQLGALLQQAGFAPAAGPLLVDDLLALLPQIGGLYLQVEGDPRAPGKGLTARLDLAPEPGSALQRYLERLAPNPAGVPLPPGDDGVLAAQLSLAPAALPDLLRPFLGLWRLYGAGDAEQQQQRGVCFDRMLAAWDGTAACRFDGSRLLLLLGTSDQKAFAAAMLDPQHLALQQQSAQQRGLELQFTPRALRHRDCELLHTRSAGPPSALLPGGELHSYAGVAAGIAVTIGGARIDADAARQAVDDLLDGKVARQPLRGADRGRAVAAVARLDLALDRLPGLPADGPDRPRQLHLLIHKVGITLKTRLDLR